MKKTIICGFTGVFLSYAITSMTYAQSSASTAKLEARPAVEKVISFSDEINIKAVRNFTREYKNISETKWFEADNGFVVYFIMNGIKTKVYYNKKGDYECKVRNYYEDRLPLEVRHLVKSNYYDFSIHCVTEISANGITAYVVNLESKTSWKTIKVVDNEMEVTQEYKKG